MAECFDKLIVRSNHSKQNPPFLSYFISVFKQAGFSTFTKPANSNTLLLNQPYKERRLLLTTELTP